MLAEKLPSKLKALCLNQIEHALFSLSFSNKVTLALSKYIDRNHISVSTLCEKLSTIDNLENQIVDMEMEKTLGKKSESIAKKIIARFEEELVTQNKEYSSVEMELDILNESMIWVDWVEQATRA